MVTIAELLEARGEIAQLEALKKRSITEDELISYGEITIRVQEGLPVMIEKATEKVKL